MLDKNAKIYIAGHRGLVGSAIWKNLQEKGYTNLVGKTHKELDLLDGVAVRRFFDEGATGIRVPRRRFRRRYHWQTASTAPTSSTRISRYSKTSLARASATT